LLLPASLFAAELPLEGVVRNASGGPAPDGDFIFFIRLYEAADAKIEVYEEAQKTVKVAQGLFHIVLGAIPEKTLPEALLTSGKPLWLGVQVGPIPNCRALHCVGRRSATSPRSRVRPRSPTPRRASPEDRRLACSAAVA
jgi:hypothetical protein